MLKQDFCFWKSQFLGKKKSTSSANLLGTDFWRSSMKKTSTVTKLTLIGSRKKSKKLSNNTQNVSRTCFFFVVKFIVQRELRKMKRVHLKQIPLKSRWSKIWEMPYFMFCIRLGWMQTKTFWPHRWVGKPWQKWLKRSFCFWKSQFLGKKKSTSSAHLLGTDFWRSSMKKNKHSYKTHSNWF